MKKLLKTQLALFALTFYCIFTVSWYPFRGLHLLAWRENLQFLYKSATFVDVLRLVVSLFTDTLHLSSLTKWAELPLAGSHHPLGHHSNQANIYFVGRQKGQICVYGPRHTVNVTVRDSTLGVLCNIPFIIRYEID